MKIALSAPYLFVVLLMGIAFATAIFAPKRGGLSGYSYSPPEVHLIPHRILRDASTTVKGQWQVEVDLVGGQRLPTPEELEYLAQSLAEKAGGYKVYDRFFIEFYFPGMATKNGGSRTGYALVKLDPEEKAPSLVRIFADNRNNWPDRFQDLPIPQGNWP